MFNLSHPKPNNDTWAVDPMLFSEKAEDQGFSGQDWDNVPKVAYETALFRKLAPPRMARVVTNPGSFVLETYGAPMPVSKEGHAHLEQVGAKEEHQGFNTTVGTAIDLSATKSSMDSMDSRGSTELGSSIAKGVPQGNAQEDEVEKAAKEVLSGDTTLASEQVDLHASNAEQSNYQDGQDPAVDPSFMDTGAELESSENEAPLDAKVFEQEAQLSSLGTSIDDEGDQSSLGKDLEDVKAQAEMQAKDQSIALEEFEVEKQALQSQMDSLKAQLESVQANEASLQVRVDELTQALAEKEANLEMEREALKAENTAVLDAQMKLLGEVTSKLDDFVNHPQRLFEPLKRLSVHIAEQLVLAELNLSGASIERLIQRCLDELSSHSQQTVTVELNTQDKARLQELTGEMFNHIQLHAVSNLQPGSVRVITDDTQVDDLIGHRLEAMANNLLAQPELWREQSPFFKQPLAQRDTEIQDVRQRITPMVERQEEDQDD